MRLSTTVSLLPLCFPGVLGNYYGPRYPAPMDLTSDKSLVAASWKKVSKVLDAELKDDKSKFVAGNVTFSTGMFSIHDDAAKSLQYHHIAEEVASNPNATNKIDGNTIFKVASVTKLFTVYAGMLQLKPKEWDTPLTEIFPTLKQTSGKEGPVYSPQWDNITPWALAAQISGVTDAAPGLSEYALKKSVNGKFGLPPVDTSDLGPCGDYYPDICPEHAYIESAKIVPATFLPWTGPAYANNGFILLGAALTAITGKSINEFYDAIFDPLDMKSSSITVPPKSEWSRSAIVPTFDYKGGATRTSGGIFSTTNDLAKMGISILNSTLLSSDRTRQWMKPITHSASLTYSNGAPWEIIRYIHKSTGLSTDLYTKLGDSGPYGGYEVLIPDYGAGFSIIAASSDAGVRSLGQRQVMDLVAENVLPALEAQAAKEAVSNYVGRYVPEDKSLNSSLVISHIEDGGNPALKIESFISNGTNVIPLFTQVGFFDGVAGPIRLHPSISNQGDGLVAFKGTRNPQLGMYTDAGKNEGPFSGAYDTNPDWLYAGSWLYGAEPTDEFVFDVDENGRAMSVRPSTTKARLVRQKDEY